MVESPKNDRYFEKLRASRIPDVQDWADYVVKLFEKLDKLLDVLETDIVTLRHTVEHEPHMWGSRIRDLALGMLMAGLHDEEEMMRKFRSIEIHRIEDLREIVNSEEHLAELMR